MAGRRVRILLVEDRVSDAELVLHELRRAGLDPDWQRVDDEPSFRARLNADIELVLADFNLPQFSAPRALAVLKESGLDIPFIIVSGSIGDQAAVDSMKGGAQDYIFKDNLSRLAAAAKRELAAADQRKAAARARQEGAARLEAIVRSALDAVVSMDEHGRILGWNPQAESMFGWTVDEALGRLISETIIPPSLREAHRAGLARYLATGESRILNQRIEVTARHRAGREFPVEISITPLSVGGRPSFSAFIRDITDRQRAEKTTAAHLAVSEALAEAGKLDAVLPRVLAAIGAHLGWDVGQVWLHDPQDGMLACAYRWLKPDAPAAAAGFDAANASARRAPGEGVVGQVWLTRGQLWMDDLSQATDAPLREAAGRAGLRSAAFAPLYAGAEVSGVVQFFSAVPRPADPALIQLLGELARRMGEYVTRAHAETALRQSETRFRGLFFDVAVGQALVGMPEGRVLAVNPAFCRLLAYHPDELIGKSIQLFADAEHADAVRQAFHLLSRDLPYYHLETRLARKRGGAVWASLGLTATFDEGDQPRNLLIQAQDISQRKETEGALEEAQRQLRHRGRHDALTELPNRTQLQELIHEATGQGEPLALLIVNLDHFKEVNDSFGYVAGDDLLKQVGPRIQECVRHDDLVARLGGDEFGVVLRGADQKSALAMAHSVGEALARPFSIDGHPLALEASIGIACSPNHGLGAEILLRRADIAMRVAKRAPGTCALFTPEYEEAGASHLTLMAELRTAIAEGGLSVHYQPLVDIKSGVVVRFEALLRWNHPIRGRIPPDQFIPFAEQTGVIQPLTDWILRNVLAQIKTWQDAGHDLGVAVNLSMRNLLDDELPERICAMIQGAGVPTIATNQLLSIEVTEGVLMADPQRSIERLNRLRQLGIRLSVDDFGTGYSSLAYLSRLPVTEMKIDRSFILGIADDPTKAAIVRAALELGHNLRLEVVAEGVEDRRTWDLLFALGCDTAQGYFMSPPMPAEAVIPWLLNAPYGRGLKTSHEAA